jgi:phenylacetate-CoA ligase
MNPRGLALEQLQLEKLNYVLGELWERNPFYTYKWCQAGVGAHQLASIEELSLFPFTTRAELLADQQNTLPLGANLTCPPYALKRIYRTSGTTKAPLYWADTPKSWAWVVQSSESLFLMAGITPENRIFLTHPLAGSAGPWIMHEGACKLGCCCLPSGIEDIQQQLHRLTLFRPNVLVGKPSHLRELAMALEASGGSAQSCNVEKLVLTGECVSNSQRRRLNDLWKVECFERYGLTEAGSVAEPILAGCICLRPILSLKLSTPVRLNHCRMALPGNWS